MYHVVAWNTFYIKSKNQMKTPRRETGLAAAADAAEAACVHNNSKRDVLQR